MRILPLLCCISLCFFKTQAEDLPWSERPAFAVLYDDVLRGNNQLLVFKRMMGEVFLTFDNGNNRAHMIASLTADGKPLAAYTTHDYEDWVLFQAPRNKRLAQVECPRIHDDLMEELRAIDGIKHVSPVLLNTGGSLLKQMPQFRYLVAVKDGTNPAEVFGDRPYQLQFWPSTYRLSAEGSSWRQMRRELNILGLDPRVRWVEPIYWAEAIGLGGAARLQTESAPFFRPVPLCLPTGVKLSVKTDAAGATITATGVAERMLTIQEFREGKWHEITTRLGEMEQEFKVELTAGYRIYRALAY